MLRAKMLLLEGLRSRAASCVGSGSFLCKVRFSSLAQCVVGAELRLDVSGQRKVTAQRLGLCRLSM